MLCARGLKHTKIRVDWFLSLPAERNGYCRTVGRKYSSAEVRADERKLKILTFPHFPKWWLRRLLRPSPAPTFPWKCRRPDNDGRASIAPENSREMGKARSSLSSFAVKWVRLSFWNIPENCILLLTCIFKNWDSRVPTIQGAKSWDSIVDEAIERTEAEGSEVIWKRKL